MRATLTIDRLGHRGEGIAELDGERVFVPLTLPGETVAVDREGNRGQVLDILAHSPDRVAPPCPHFGACGGCQLQHMAPAVYEGFKRGLVASALAWAGLAAETEEMVAAHGEGRRRATLHAAGGAAGFMALRSHTIHDLDACPILVPALARAPQIARAISALLGPCDVAFTASAMGLDVAIRAKGAGVHKGLAAIARDFDLARLALNGEVLVVARPPLIAMGRADVPLPVGGFLQATARAEAVLADLVLEATRGAREIADLFCGVGPFALRLAERATVFAADSDAPAIAALDAARRKASKLKPITAERRDLFREPLGVFELNRFDAVVLDPPRAGAQAQAKELARSRVPTVAYVSCDPQSFARDAAILVAGGYHMGPVTPVDQFAFSAHTEVFARFSRR
ncbi:class I SAM-dependent RNA methyltransferase [Pelagibacterium lacus]|uniref:Class I SAM-dependent RNA methyltransferase n=1 Tax=Pelagibacterium lacus TaxID=2282655 RepID=A0A369W5S9_9HYPH|nr:methyltransferase [Pelagibacterium lacus]RDE09377.1 class I SAM-dependent RNA methyltransferase [Pelagibacterium lacus]